MLKILSNKIAFRTGAIALSLTVLILSLEAWRDFSQEREDRFESLAQERSYIAKNSAHSMSLPLYEYDVEIINNMAEALIDHQDIVAVDVIEFNGTPIARQSEDVTPDNVVSERTDILTPSGNLLGYLSIEFSNDRMLADLHSEILSSLITIAILVLCLFGVIAWSIALIVRPVTRLEAAVRAYDGRNWPDTVPGMRRDDEVGSLAKTFAAMAAQLKGLFDDLEGRVEERTQALAQALDEAKAASRAKSAFLANMSHEIRTPMNGVLGMAEQLKHTELDDRQQLFADTIYKSGNSLLVVINDILDFSKIESGKLELDPVSFDLRSAVEDVATLLQIHAREKGLEIILRVDPSLPRSVIGDASRIRQVVTNLVGNAIKFTETGHISIDITGKADGDKLDCRIEITDTGIGIAEDKVAEIFEEFAQAEQSTTRKFGGTGLGLAISRRLANLMGGEIGVTSELGAGSCFWFTVSLELDPAAAAPMLGDDELTGVRVLIAEMPEVSREAVAELCRQWGMDVTAVSLADEVVACIALGSETGNEFDIVILGEQLEDGDTSTCMPVLTEYGVSPKRTIVLSPAENAPMEASRDAVRVLKPIKADILREALVAAMTGDAAENDDGAHQQAEEPAEPDVGTVRRIMVVEDNEVNRLVIGTILSASPYDVVFAENGSVACQLYDDNQFDAIVMDLSMPVMDGYEATAEIRRRERERKTARTPIICLTAHALKGQEEICREHDMDDFLTKPVKKDAVFGALERWTSGADAAPGLLRERA